MATAKQKELTRQEVRSILALSVPATKRRLPTDAEVADILPKLAKHLGAKEASLPSSIRRIVVHSETGAPLLLVDGQHQPLSTTIFPLALPMASACELLASAQNPEIALQSRLDRDKAKAAAEKEEARTDAEARKRKREAEARLAKERADFRASDWEMLGGLRRFAVRLALLVQGRDAGLANGLRTLVADSLSGADADFPRSEWWPGLGIEQLDEETARACASMAEQERDARAVAAIDPARLRQLRLMYGPNDFRSILNAHKLFEAQREQAVVHFPAAGL